MSFDGRNFSEGFWKESLFIIYYYVYYFIEYYC